MRLPRLFHGRRSRKYPIKRDAQGLSLRERCFHDFDEGKGPAEVGRIYNVKEDTAFRYHREWQQRGPHYEERYAFIQEMLHNVSLGQRDKTVGLLAKVWGTDKENMESVLSTPHGLGRLLGGKILLPSREKTCHKMQMSLELGYILADYLVKRHGRCSELYLTLKEFLEKGLKFPTYTDNAESEQTLESVYKIMVREIENEKRDGIKQGGLSVEEGDSTMNPEINQAVRQAEIIYLEEMTSLIDKGSTPEQAHQKIYLRVILKGNLKGAGMMQRFYDKFFPPKE
jgi:hypothetical protein